MEGQTDIIEGKVGQVLHLGTNDRIEVLHRKGLDLINAWSVDTWAHADKAPNNGGVVAAQWFSKRSIYQLNWDHNSDMYKIAASWMSAGWLIVAQIQEELEANTWYHITVV